MTGLQNKLMVLLGAAVVALCVVAGFWLMSSNVELPAESGAPATAAETMAASQPVGLVIKMAAYGDLPGGASVDVTQKVIAAAGRMAVSIDASNDNFGDPAVNIPKKLRVDYLANGVPRSRTVNEGETLTIRVKAGPARLVIKSAIYGDLPNGSSTDVTDKVASMTDGDALSVAASNDNFGDPAAGIAKQLRVIYTANGREKTMTVAEGETMKISADD